MTLEISASQAVALKTVQTRQSAARVGMQSALKKDQEVVAMLVKAGDQLQAVTANRGNRVNISV
ncbi:MAG: hypothetical protein HQ483_04700 [Rhodospirillales bacterium]|nr:hypothetical protein [Rhodospirillales bacterium]